MALTLPGATARLDTPPSAWVPMRPDKTPPAPAPTALSAPVPLIRDSEGVGSVPVGASDVCVGCAVEAGAVMRAARGDVLVAGCVMVDVCGPANGESIPSPTAGATLSRCKQTNVNKFNPNSVRHRASLYVPRRKRSSGGNSRSAGTRLH